VPATKKTLGVYKPVLNSKKLDDMAGEIAEIVIVNRLLINDASYMNHLPIHDSFTENRLLDFSPRNHHLTSDVSHMNRYRQLHQSLQDRLD
jgi:hypothetical protein